MYDEHSKVLNVWLIQRSDWAIGTRLDACQPIFDTPTALAAVVQGSNSLANALCDWVDKIVAAFCTNRLVEGPCRFDLMRHATSRLLDVQDIPFMTRARFVVINIIWRRSRGRWRGKASRAPSSARSYIPWTAWPKPQGGNRGIRQSRHICSRNGVREARKRHCSVVASKLNDLVNNAD